MSSRRLPGVSLFVLSACAVACSDAAEDDAGGASGTTDGVASATSSGGFATSSASVASSGSGGIVCAPPATGPSCAVDGCRLPVGCFLMGSPASEYGRDGNEGPTEVHLDMPGLVVWIARAEVTQAEWEAVGFVNPSAQAGGEGDCLDPECPVGNVSFYEAAAYANERSTRESLAPYYTLEGCTGAPGAGMVCTSVTFEPGAEGSYRLPTAAEWEYAARAGTTTAFFSGDAEAHPIVDGCEPDPDLDAVAWYCDTAAGTTHPVRQTTPNGWLLFDMLGNAAEWTTSRYAAGGFGAAPLTYPVDPPMPDAGDAMIVKGGDHASSARGVRAGAMRPEDRSTRRPGLGFRIAKLERVLR